jgi:hypothetical protein
MTRPRAIRLSLAPLLCVLLGAATTVGVAWRLSGLHFLPTGGHRLTGSDAVAHGWPTWEVRSLPGPELVEVGRWPGIRIEYVSVLGPPVEGQRTSQTAVTYHSGWPWLALWRGESGPFQERALPGGWTLMDWPGGLQVVHRPAKRSLLRGYSYVFEDAQQTWAVAYLPVWPAWPGLALDTGFYAAAWWVLLFTPLPLYRTARRRLRASRGMCGICGYDLKGSPGGPCPECGKETAL